MCLFFSLKCVYWMVSYVYFSRLVLRFYFMLGYSFFSTHIPLSKNLSFLIWGGFTAMGPSKVYFFHRYQYCVFTVRSLLLFKPTKQRSSRKHPSVLLPKAGAQRSGIRAWEHTEREHVCSAAVENPAKKAAATWVAKADLPVEGSDGGWSRGLLERSTNIYVNHMLELGRSGGRFWLQGRGAGGADEQSFLWRCFCDWLNK